MDNLTEGQIVHFHADEYAKHCQAAMVVRVWSPACANLYVFPDVPRSTGMLPSQGELDAQRRCAGSGPRGGEVTFYEMLHRMFHPSCPKRTAQTCDVRLSLRVQLDKEGIDRRQQAGKGLCIHPAAIRAFALAAAVSLAPALLPADEPIVFDGTLRTEQTDQGIAVYSGAERVCWSESRQTWRDCRIVPRADQLWRYTVNAAGGAGIDAATSQLAQNAGAHEGNWVFGFKFENFYASTLLYTALAIAIPEGLELLISWLTDSEVEGQKWGLRASRLLALVKVGIGVNNLKVAHDMNSSRLTVTEQAAELAR